MAKESTILQSIRASKQHTVPIKIMHDESCCLFSSMDLLFGFTAIQLSLLDELNESGHSRVVRSGGRLND